MPPQANNSHKGKPKWEKRQDNTILADNEKNNRCYMLTTITLNQDKCYKIPSSITQDTLGQVASNELPLSDISFEPLFSDAEKTTLLSKHLQASDDGPQYQGRKHLLADLTYLCQHINTHTSSIDPSRLAQIKQTIREDIENCSQGFHNRVRIVITTLSSPKTMDELLYEVRKDMVQSLILRHSHTAIQSSHVINDFFLTAYNEGYGLRPLNQHDSYRSDTNLQTIKTQIQQSFAEFYSPIQLPATLCATIRLTLENLGLPDAHLRNRDNWISPEIIERCQSFLQQLFSLDSETTLPCFISKQEEIYDEVYTLYYDINWQLIEQWCTHALISQQYFQTTPSDPPTLNECHQLFQLRYLQDSWLNVTQVTLLQHRSLSSNDVSLLQTISQGSQHPQLKQLIEKHETTIRQHQLSYYSSCFFIMKQLLETTKQCLALNATTYSLLRKPQNSESTLIHLKMSTLEKLVKYWKQVSHYNQQDIHQIYNSPQFTQLTHQLIQGDTSVLNFLFDCSQTFKTAANIKTSIKSYFTDTLFDLFTLCTPEQFNPTKLHELLRKITTAEPANDPLLVWRRHFELTLTTSPSPSQFKQHIEQENHSLLSRLFHTHRSLLPIGSLHAKSLLSKDIQTTISYNEYLFSITQLENSATLHQEQADEIFQVMSCFFSTKNTAHRRYHLYTTTDLGYIDSLLKTPWLLEKYGIGSIEDQSKIVTQINHEITRCFNRNFTQNQHRMTYWILQNSHRFAMFFAILCTKKHFFDPFINLLDIYRTSLSNQELLKLLVQRMLEISILKYEGESVSHLFHYLNTSTNNDKLSIAYHCIDETYTSLSKLQAIDSNQKLGYLLMKISNRKPRSTPVLPSAYSMRAKISHIAIRLLRSYNQGKGVYSFQHVTQLLLYANAWTTQHHFTSIRGELNAYLLNTHERIQHDRSNLDVTQAHTLEQLLKIANLTAMTIIFMRDTTPSHHKIAESGCILHHMISKTISCTNLQFQLSQKICSALELHDLRFWSYQVILQHFASSQYNEGTPQHKLSKELANNDLSQILASIMLELTPRHQEQFKEIVLQTEKMEELERFYAQSASLTLAAQYTVIDENNLFLTFLLKLFSDQKFWGQFLSSIKSERSKEGLSIFTSNLADKIPHLPLKYLKEHQQVLLWILGSYKTTYQEAWHHLHTLDEEEIMVEMEEYE